MTRELRLSFLNWAYIASVGTALILGALLADPGHVVNALLVALLLLALAVPILLHGHHLLLICAANTSVIVYFLPGQPALWMVLAICSLGIAVLDRAIRKDTEFIHVPAVAWPLVVLGVVVLGTAALRGGIGSRVMGSDVFGGSRYFATFAAVFGYFGLVTRPIRREHGLLLASLFFLGGTTAAISDLVYMAGPRFYFLYAFFPTQLAYLQAITQDSLVRSTGLTWAALSVFYFTLLRFGIRGILDVRRPWRGAMFAGAVAVAFLGGYRSSVLLMAVVLAVQFVCEGLHRTRVLPILLLIGAVAVPLFLGNLDRMPLTVQRSFSFLPVDVDPRAKADAAATLDWRVTMWRIMLPEIPNYLWLGKGYGFSGSDFYLTQEAVRSGVYQGYEEALVTGDYHNGWLTLMIPFGVWGVIGFMWLGMAGAWVLWRNWRYGDEALKRVNTFLLAFFVSRYLFYLSFYGKFDQDLFVFTGALGLSVALNHGVRKPEDLQTESEAVEPATVAAPLTEAPAPSLPA